MFADFTAFSMDAALIPSITFFDGGSMRLSISVTGARLGSGAWIFSVPGMSGIIDCLFFSAICQAFPFSIKLFATFSKPKL